MKAADTRDVAQGIGARGVAECRGIGHGAYADTIEHDPGDPAEHKLECNTVHGEGGSCRRQPAR